MYPLNLVADLNAVLGLFYVHTYGRSTSAWLDNATTTPVVSQHGDTTYYFFESQDLPLFGPLRTLGVPEPVIDVVEPFFRVIVEQGYDRSIPAWEPTPARLIPKFNPAKVAGELRRRDRRGNRQRPRSRQTSGVIENPCGIAEYIRG